MSKVGVYSQTNNFYKSRETKNDSRSIGEKYFYVDSQKAKDSAEFFAYLIKTKNIALKSSIKLNIMDLCFGSGNLTSHLVLDNALTVEKIYLNDIDNKVTNQKINIDDKSDILDLDFLDFKQFNDYENSINILVFNPTISDGDIHRKISIKDSDQLINYDSSFSMEEALKKYFESQALEVIKVDINEDNKSMKIEVDGNKSELSKLPNSFNNYSITCKTKKMQEYEDKASIITQINQTISKILKENGLIIFVGTDKQRESIFQNYNTTFRYLRDDNDIFVIQKSESEVIKCFEKDETGFVSNFDCAIKKETNTKVESFDDISLDTDNFSSSKEVRKIESPMKEEKYKFSNDVLGNSNFLHKNILLKGVPGTGKSHTIDNIIKNDLNMKDIQDNVLRINIHSASSNSDLMQGISISTTDDNKNVLYKEKKGVILKHIFKAMYKPNQPFVLVLEEIQENSLNELIGDLIYLIEKDKRTKIELEDNQELTHDELIAEVEAKNSKIHSVVLPNLVDDRKTNSKMIMPDNLYIFCTSNYRDDRKVIEDNLLRRFDVIEIYPQYQDDLGEEIFKSKDVSNFLSKLNELILKQFKDETHPDRYLVGHANWLEIGNKDSDENKKLFYTALLKVIIEFKEIREVDFKTYVKPILDELFKKEYLTKRIGVYLEIFYNDGKLEINSYKEIVDRLQKEIYPFIIKK